MLVEKLARRENTVKELASAARPTPTKFSGKHQFTAWRALNVAGPPTKSSGVHEPLAAHVRWSAYWILRSWATNNLLMSK